MLSSRPSSWHAPHPLDTEVEAGNACRLAAHADGPAVGKDPARAVGKDLGHAAARAEQRARDVLTSLPQGTLAEHLTPELLHRVHHLACPPSDPFAAWQGRLSLRDLADWMTCRHAVGTPERDAGPLPDGHGTTVFPTASEIPEQLALLCADLRRRLPALLCDPDPLTGAWTAARFMLNLMAIHPYEEGNRRVSRCMAQAVLREFGLPEPDWPRMNVHRHSQPEAVAAAFLRPPPPDDQDLPQLEALLRSRSARGPQAEVSTVAIPRVTVTASLRDAAGLNSARTSFHSAPSRASSLAFDAPWEPRRQGAATLPWVLRMSQPLPRAPAQRQREVLLRLRDMARAWPHMAPSEHSQLAGLLISPAWVGHMAGMNAEYNGGWRLPIARGAQEPLLQAQSNTKTQVNQLYLRMLTSMIMEGLLPGDLVLNALTRAPTSDPHGRPSYLHTAASHALFDPPEPRSQALADFLAVAARGHPRTVAKRLQRTLLTAGADADVLGDKYADLLGRLVQDGRPEHLSAANALAMTQLQALGGIPGKGELKRHFGTTRAHKYEKGQQAAQAFLRQHPQPAPGSSTAPLASILSRLQEVIRPEQLAAAARRERALAEAEHQKQTRWHMTDELLQTLADRARQAWSGAITQDRHDLSAGWLAWVASPEQAGAYAGRLDLLPMEAPPDFVAAVCAEALQSPGIQALTATSPQRAHGAVETAVESAVESAVNRCLQDMERAHGRFTRMVEQQELGELEERLEILKLDRRLDALREDASP